MNNFLIDTTVVYEQDLTRMLSRQVKDKKIVFSFKAPEKSHSVKSKSFTVPVKYDLSPDIYERRYRSEVNDLKVLIFRDSFGETMEKFLKESFGEVVLIWRHEFNKAIIEQENPDIVIQIIVEREIDLLLKEKW